MDTDGFAIAITFERLPCLLQGGVAIHSENIDLADSYGTNGVPISKAVAQHLEVWSAFLG